MNKYYSEFSLLCRMLGCLFVALAAPGFASAEEASTTQSNTTAYPVDHFEIVYAAEHSSLPPLASLQDAEVTLSRSEQAFLEPVPGLEVETLTLSQLAAVELPLGPSAMGQVSRSLVRLLNGRGLVGVYVAPAADDIDLETGTDLRGDDRRSLRLVVWVGRAQKLRTTAAGYGIDAEQGADRAQDSRILRNSPIQPYAGSGERADLLEISELEDYVHRLNRHPRRNTRLALTSGNEPASVNLEYQIFHERPWSFYTEASNHGTESTGMRRHRVGFLHHQLTGRDDTLYLEWMGGRPGEVQAMVSSYEAPIFGSERFRFRVSGLWSEFNAEQLGFSGLNFEGQQSEYGTQLVGNLLQRGRFFVDAFAGFAWQNIDVDNKVTLVSSDQDFLSPELGIRLERFAPTAAFSTEVKVRRHYSRADASELGDFGRFQPDEDPATATWRLSYSTYLEPWLAKALGRSDSQAGRGRVHELRFLTQGLWSFNERLIPQLQQIAGGPTTVRGYSQAALAGDNVRLGSAEYRLHLPRLFASRNPSKLPVAGDFAFVPRPDGGNPDWDLVLIGFFDTAHVSQVDREPDEISETLSSLGVGVELAIKRLIRVQASCGWGRDPQGFINGVKTRVRVKSSDRCRVSGMALF